MSRMFISLDLMLLLNMNKSHVNLLSSAHLGGRKSCVEFKQESLTQLSLEIVRCSLVLYFDLWIIFVLLLNLVTTITCYSSLVWCLFGPPICVIWNSSLGVCLVMVLRLVFCGAMTKPRASLWPAGTWLCYWVRAGIEVASHSPLWNYIDVGFLVRCSLVIFPYRIVRSLS
jgi:hypothetical protein